MSPSTDSIGSSFPVPNDTTPALPHTFRGPLVRFYSAEGATKTTGPRSRYATSAPCC
jgi:hypothetical protein